MPGINQVRDKTMNEMIKKYIQEFAGYGKKITRTVLCEEIDRVDSQIKYMILTQTVTGEYIIHPVHWIEGEEKQRCGTGDGSYLLDSTEEEAKDLFKQRVSDYLR